MKQKTDLVNLVVALNKSDLKLYDDTITWCYCLISNRIRIQANWWCDEMANELLKITKKHKAAWYFTQTHVFINDWYGYKEITHHFSINLWKFKN